MNSILIKIPSIVFSICPADENLFEELYDVFRLPLNLLTSSKTILLLPLPTPLQMEEIYWHIITSENAGEVFKKLEEAGIDPVLFGITDKDFQVLARNFAQIRQKLQETNNLLQEYQKYYEGTE